MTRKWRWWWHHSDLLHSISFSIWKRGWYLCFSVLRHVTYVVLSRLPSTFSIYRGYDMWAGEDGIVYDREYKNSIREHRWILTTVFPQHTHHDNNGQTEREREREKRKYRFELLHSFTPSDLFSIWFIDFSISQLRTAIESGHSLFLPAVHILQIKSISYHLAWKTLLYCFLYRYMLLSE